MIAVIFLAQADIARPPTARNRTIAAAMKAVAESLGNTPAVARASYVDPAVLDRYSSCWTIAPALEASADFALPKVHRRVEEAVLDLLGDARSSDAVAKTPLQ